MPIIAAASDIIRVFIGAIDKRDEGALHQFPIARKIKPVARRNSI